MIDLAIAGAGPAGCALAIAAASRGLEVVLLDRAPAPPDKACGEGILPAGVALLRELGLRVDPARSSPFAGIRYVQEDGSSLEGRFASAPGLGVRRTALSEALWERVAGAGAELRSGVVVEHLERDASSAILRTSSGSVRAALAVAADGLHSRLRRQAGLDAGTSGPRRFGVRRHLAVRPWTDLVEVHWARGAEAYVTPTGPDRVGVAFLLHEGSASVDQLLCRFPVLRERLAGAEVASEDRGAGPLLQRVAQRTADRLVLLGDAAGYVDAITGEGISLALACAADLAELLPAVLRAGATARSLAPYERIAASRFAAYARATRAVLLLSRHPSVRRALLSAGARLPGAFQAAMRAAVDGEARALRRLTVGPETGEGTRS